MAQQISLGVQTWFSPDDDTQTVFLDFLRQAQHEIKIAIYGFHLPPAVPILLDKVRTGVIVDAVMDRVQSKGKYEAPEVQQLVDGGVGVTIGDSQKHHIMHHKFVVVDHLHVLAGSWNFSESASLESNYIQIVSNADMATLFLNKWQEMHDWMQEHEKSWQPKITISPTTDNLP
jgi:phosphatidylserine/phosphatidylglycerophosphate/cardiolipin synthase-like enzyme